MGAYNFFADINNVNHDGFMLCYKTFIYQNASLWVAYNFEATSFGKNNSLFSRRRDEDELL